MAKPKKKIPKEYAALMVLLLFSLVFKSFRLTEGGIKTNLIIPAILSVLVLFLVYDIGFHETKNMRAGLFAAALAVFIPIVTLSQQSIIRPLEVIFFLFILYLFTQVNSEKKWSIFLFVPVVFAIVSKNSLFLVPIFIIFYIFVKIFKLKLTEQEAMYIALTSMIILLINAVSNQNPFSLFELNYFGLMKNYFSVSKIISIAGFLPFVFGTLGFILAFAKKNKVSLLMSSTILGFVVYSAVCPLSFGFILPIVFIVLSCLGAISYVFVMDLVRKTKLKKHTLKIEYLLFGIIIYLAINHWIRAVA